MTQREIEKLMQPVRDCHADDVEVVLSDLNN
jgi:hypothetical protein